LSRYNPGQKKFEGFKISPGIFFCFNGGGGGAGSGAVV